MYTGSLYSNLFLLIYFFNFFFQEIGAHRKKFDMSVMSVAFHPSRPIIGSAGADSLAKIYTSQNSYIDDSLNA